jgi:hypothetical protein
VPAIKAYNLQKMLLKITQKLRNLSSTTLEDKYLRVLIIKKKYLAEIMGKMINLLKDLKEALITIKMMAYLRTTQDNFLLIMRQLLDYIIRIEKLSLMKLLLTAIQPKMMESLHLQL